MSPDTVEERLSGAHVRFTVNILKKLHAGGAVEFSLLLKKMVVVCPSASPNHVDLESQARNDCLLALATGSAYNI